MVDDSKAVDGFVARAAAAAALAPASAQVRWTSGTTTFTVIPAVVGRTLDVATTRAALEAALTRPGGGDIAVTATDPRPGAGGDRRDGRAGRAAGRKRSWRTP